MQIFVQPLESRRLLSLTPAGAEVTVPFPSEVTEFDMAVAGDGSFIVVGDLAEEPFDHVVLAVRYSAAGEQIGDVITIDDVGFNPVVSMDADGDAVIAYQPDVTTVDVVRIAKNGVVSPAQRVGSVHAHEKILEVDVSMDDAGGFFVGWMREQDTSRPIEYVRAFDAAGQPRGPQFEVDAGSSANQHVDLDVAALPDGSGAIVTHVEFNETTDIVHAYRVNASGVVTPKPLPDGIGGNSYEPEAATYPDGSYVVVMNATGRSGPSGFGIVQRFDASGMAVGDRIQVAGSARSLTVDALPDGGSLVGYVQVLDDPTKPFDDVATSYVERFSRDGVAIGGPLTLDAGPSKGHRLGVGPDGAVVVAYLQMAANELTGEVRTGEVHFRRLTVAGSRLAGAELFVNGGEGNDHIIVERVRQNLFVNINGIVERFNAADVQFISINGFGGDDDIANGTALPSTIHGGDGSDTMWGGVGPDSIRGQGGDDSLRGGDGDDLLLGDTGNDTLHGGTGTDTLTGAKGDDALILGELLDRVVPGVTFTPGDRFNDGTVTVVGTDGDDRITLERIGDGTVVTVNGLSTAFPGSPRHTLMGLGGNDTLTGDANSQDVLDGGPGSDAMFGGNNSRDVVDYSSRTNAVTVTFDDIANDGETGENDLLQGIGGVLGGSGNDRLTGNEFGNVVHGGGGDDTIDGGAGLDRLFGEDGNDELHAGQGNDHLEGGAGDDLLDADDVELNQLGTGDLLFAGAGNDRLFTEDGFRDLLRGGPGDDLADADPRDLDVRDVEAIRIVSREGGAVIRREELFVFGSDAGEVINVQRIGDELVVDIDNLQHRFTAAVVRFLTINGFGGGDDIVNATDLPSTIHGGDGSDTLWGGIGPDSMRGQGGNDALHGGDGDDLLFGDTGNDSLHGGDGTDALTGGTGDDALLFGELLDGVLATGSAI